MGCDACDQRGYETFAECPLRAIDADTIELRLLAKLAEKGALPVAGGTLDQAQQFLEACTYYWSEEARMRNELKLVRDE